YSFRESTHTRAHRERDEHTAQGCRHRLHHPTGSVRCRGVRRGRGGRGRGGGGEGCGDINIPVTSFPDYIDPQLSYTLEGWEVLWNVYTPLLTYKHEAGEGGTEGVSAPAPHHPQISHRGT